MTDFETVQKNAKTLVKGEISIICANCDLDRTKEKNPLTTHCPKCGFNPFFPNKIVQRLQECEKEFARQLEFLVNKEVKKLKTTLQELLKNRPMLNIRPDGTTDEDTLRDYLFKLRDWFQTMEKLGCVETEQK